MSDSVMAILRARPRNPDRDLAFGSRGVGGFGDWGRAKAVLDALLEKYEDDGLIDLSDARVLQIPPIDRMGTPIELVRSFGSKAGFEQAVHELQDALYGAA